MEDSTYETFEDELGTPLQEEPPAKPLSQIRRTDKQASWKMKEEPQSPQNVPKTAQKEVSKHMSKRRALSIQNLRQMETPWEGITLNRCLFVAITILIISSGLQRLHEALKALRAEEDCERVKEDGEGVEHSLVLRHTGLKQDRTQPQPESSLWDSLFWWVLEDEDEENEESTARKTRKTEMGMKGVRGGSGRAKYWETLGSAGRKREKRKEKRGRGREQEEEAVTGKKGREKRETVKQWEVGEEEETPRKKLKERDTREKRSEVTELTE